MSSTTSSSETYRGLAVTLSSSSDGVLEKKMKLMNQTRPAEKLLAPGGNRFKLLSLCTVLSVATNFPEGYSNSYPNTSHQSFKDMINGTYASRGKGSGLSDSAYTWYWSVVLNVWFIGYLFGTFVTPFFTDVMGRKKSLLIANCIALLGAILSFFGTYYAVPEVFIVSRLVSSLSSGISFGSLLLLLQETTPTEQRGVTSFLCESTFILTMGIGIGCGMDVVLGTNLPLLTGISIIPAVVAILITLPLYESPKFLLINKEDRKAALASLEFYRGECMENELVLEEMMLEKEMEEDEDKNFQYNVTILDHVVSMIQGIREVLTQGHLRIAYLLGSAALQIVVGIWPIMYLSTEMLEVNFSADVSQLSSLAFILADFLASLFGMTIIERYGRRVLLLSLGVGNTASLCLYVACDLLIPVWDPIRWGQIIALILFGITYGIALGPIAFFISSELTAQRSRSIVQSMVFGTNTMINFVFSLLTLPAYTTIGPLSFIPLFVVPSIISIVFLYFYLPETRAKEVHEVVEELMARHNPRALSLKDKSSVSALSSIDLYAMDVDKKNSVMQLEIRA